MQSRWVAVHKCLRRRSDIGVNPHHHHHHHHHMALQPNSGPGLPFWGFVTITLLRGWIVSSAPNPQPGRPSLRIYDPRTQGGPAVPPGSGYPFWSPFTTCMGYSGTILECEALGKSIWDCMLGKGRSQWPRGLRRRSAAAWLLGSRVRIPLGV
jgi:hypothetical protein